MRVVGGQDQHDVDVRAGDDLVRVVGEVDAGEVPGRQGPGRRVRIGEGMHHGALSRPVGRAGEGAAQPVSEDAEAQVGPGASGGLSHGAAT